VWVFALIYGWTRWVPGFLLSLWPTHDELPVKDKWFDMEPDVLVSVRRIRVRTAPRYERPGHLG